jgi:hypothetical protein
MSIIEQNGCQLLDNCFEIAEDGPESLEVLCYLVYHCSWGPNPYRKARNDIFQDLLKHHRETDDINVLWREARQMLLSENLDPAGVGIKEIEFASIGDYFKAFEGGSLVYKYRMVYRELERTINGESSVSNSITVSSNSASGSLQSKSKLKSLPLFTQEPYQKLVVTIATVICLSSNRRRLARLLTAIVRTRCTSCLPLLLKLISNCPPVCYDITDLIACEWERANKNEDEINMEFTKKLLLSLPAFPSPIPTITKELMNKRYGSKVVNGIILVDDIVNSNSKSESISSSSSPYILLNIVVASCVRSTLTIKQILSEICLDITDKYLNDHALYFASVLSTSCSVIEHPMLIQLSRERLLSFLQLLLSKWSSMLAVDTLREKIECEIRIKKTGQEKEENKKTEKELILNLQSIAKGVCALCFRLLSEDPRNIHAKDALATLYNVLEKYIICQLEHEYESESPIVSTLLSRNTKLVHVCIELGIAITIARVTYDPKQELDNTKVLCLSTMLNKLALLRQFDEPSRKTFFYLRCVLLIACDLGHVPLNCKGGNNAWEGGAFAAAWCMRRLCMRILCLEGMDDVLPLSGMKRVVRTLEDGFYKGNQVLKSQHIVIRDEFLLLEPPEIIGGVDERPSDWGACLLLLLLSKDWAVAFYPISKIKHKLKAPLPVAADIDTDADAIKRTDNYTRDQMSPNTSANIHNSDDDPIVFIAICRAVSPMHSLILPIISAWVTRIIHGMKKSKIAGSSVQALAVPLLPKHIENLVLPLKQMNEWRHMFWSSESLALELQAAEETPTVRQFGPRRFTHETANLLKNYLKNLTQNNKNHKTSNNNNNNSNSSSSSSNRNNNNNKSNESDINSSGSSTDSDHEKTQISTTSGRREKRWSQPLSDDVTRALLACYFEIKYIILSIDEHSLGIATFGVDARTLPIKNALRIMLTYMSDREEYYDEFVIQRSTCLALISFLLDGTRRLCPELLLPEGIRQLLNSTPNYDGSSLRAYLDTCNSFSSNSSNNSNMKFTTSELRTSEYLRVINDLSAIAAPNKSMPSQSIFKIHIKHLIDVVLYNHTSIKRENIIDNNGDDDGDFYRHQMICWKIWLEIQLRHPVPQEFELLTFNTILACIHSSNDPSRSVYPRPIVAYSMLVQEPLVLLRLPLHIITKPFILHFILHILLNVIGASDHESFYALSIKRRVSQSLAQIVPSSGPLENNSVTPQHIVFQKTQNLIIFRILLSLWKEFATIYILKGQNMNDMVSKLNNDKNERKSINTKSNHHKRKNPTWYKACAITIENFLEKWIQDPDTYIRLLFHHDIDQITFNLIANKYYFYQHIINYIKNIIEHTNNVQHTNNQQKIQQIQSIIHKHIPQFTYTIQQICTFLDYFRYLAELRYTNQNEFNSKIETETETETENEVELFYDYNCHFQQTTQISTEVINILSKIGNFIVKVLRSIHVYQDTGILTAKISTLVTTLARWYPQIALVVIHDLRKISDSEDINTNPTHMKQIIQHVIDAYPSSLISSSSSSSYDIDNGGFTWKAAVGSLDLLDDDDAKVQAISLREVCSGSTGQVTSLSGNNGGSNGGSSGNKKKSRNHSALALALDEDEYRPSATSSRYKGGASKRKKIT